MFLFLKPVPEENGLGVKDDPEARVVVPSGVRLVRDGKAAPFVQFDNPGPVVAADPNQLSELSAPTVAEFRDRIAAAITAAERYAKRFETPASPDDVPWLLDLLRERARSEPPPRQDLFSFLADRDKVAEEACLRLANLHDLEGLDAAASLDLPYRCRGVIKRGFATPAGRDFVLARVSDETLDADRRLRYAETLRDNGRDYHSPSGSIGPGGSSSRPSEVADNGAYVTRIAQAAKEVRSEAVRVAILEALAWFSSGLPGRPDDDPIRVDLRGALPALLELHRTTASEPVRFGVERVVARVSRKAYDELGSRCGPVVSLLSPESPPSRVTRGERWVRFDYAIIPLDHEPTEPPVVVFTNPATDVERVVPSGLKFRGRHEAVAGGVVALPQDLPAGRYRVSLRFSRGGKAVSDGYGFEAEL